MTYDGNVERWDEWCEDRIGGVEFRFATMPWNWRLRWTFHVLLVGCASTIGVLLAWWVA